MITLCELLKTWLSGSPPCLLPYQIFSLSILQLLLLVESQAFHFHLDYHFPNCILRIIDPQGISSISLKNKVWETLCIPDASLEGL